MEEITEFRMKDCFSLPRMGWKYFNSLGIEEYEPTYTYNDKYMRWFFRHAMKGGRVCAFNQYFKSEKICDGILKIISEVINVKGNKYDIIEANLNFENKNVIKLEKVYEIQFDHYKDEDVEEKKICQ